MTPYRVASPLVLGAGLLTLAFAQPVFAQRPSSVIRGRVVDLTGAALTGVTLVLNGPALITPDLTTTSDSRGDFRFATLEPGVYEVRAELDGFAPVRRSNVDLPVGLTVQLIFELQPQLRETIVVTADSPTVDLVTSTSSVVYARNMLQSIPNDRYFGTVFNFAPGVVSDSARGAPVRGNVYRLDGVDITDPVVGTPFVFFNYDNFNQIQVQTGSRAAEYGQATGAVINLVTKSGGSRFSGDANLYFSNENMTAINGEAITARFPSLTPGRFLDLLDGQAQLGGPLVRDRAWFFGSYRWTTSESTVPGFNDASGRPIPHGLGWKYTFGKMSSQLNRSHRLVAAFNVNSFTDDNRGAGSLTPVESTSLEDSGAWTTNLEWTGMLPVNALVELRYTSVDNHFDLRAKNDLPRCQDFNTGVAGCSDGSTDFNVRKRRQLHGALSLDRRLGGLHTLKFGAEYERSSDWRDLSYNQGRYYNVGDNGSGTVVPWTVWTLQDPPTEEAIGRVSFFAQDSWNLTNRLTLNLGLRADVSEGWFPQQRLANGSLQTELRDVVGTTNLSPRAGFAFDPFGHGTTVVRGSYARYVSGLTTTSFYVVNQNAPAGQLHVVCAGPIGGFCSPGDGELSTTVFNQFGPSTTKIDTALALPKTNEFAIGFEQQLRPSMSLTVNFVYKRDADLIEDVETMRAFVARTARDPGDTELDAAGNVVAVIPPQTITIYEPNFSTGTQLVITNPDAATRWYRGLEMIVDKRLSKRWFMQSSLVVSKSMGVVGTSFFGSSGFSSLFNNPNALINANGKLDLNQTCVLKTMGTYQFPLDFSVSALYRWLSGGPYTRTAVLTSYDSNGDGINDTALAGGSVTINAEPLGSRTLDSLHIMDLGVQKEIKLAGGRRLGLRWDVYNLFNVDTVLSKRSRTSSAGNFGEPLNFVGPRGTRVALLLSF